MAPSNLPNPFGEINAMFGLGISKGVDIDSNGYRDLAISSPNDDTVYIFKSYPVIKVLASIMSSKSEITLEDSSIVIKVCVSLSTKTEINGEIGNCDYNNIILNLEEKKNYVLRNSNFTISKTTNHRYLLTTFIFFFCRN